MKRYLHLLILLLLVACTANQTQVNSTNTPGPVITQSAKPTDLTPAATTTISPTVLPPTEPPIATNSDVPFTPSPFAPTPHPNPTNISIPTGRIIFLWDQANPSISDGPVKVQPTMGLFQGIPGDSPDDWHVQSLLTDFHAIVPAYLAPDRSKLALLVMDEERSSYSNFYQIYLYTFATGQVTHIENQEYLDTLSWLPDSETIVYPQITNLFQVRLSDLVPQQLTENPLPPTEHELNGLIGQIAGSPDGLWQAINRYPGDLALYNVNLDTTTLLADQVGNDSLNLNWSPNSKWLMFTKEYSLDLYVTNTETFSITQLATEPGSIYYAAWSPDSHWLAYTQSSTLFLWGTETQATSELVTSSFIGEPSWSPDGLTIATGFSQDTDAGILLFYVNTGEIVKMSLGMTTNKVIWSPDGQWLLFYMAKNDNSAGLYIVDVYGNNMERVLDTTNTLKPYQVTWIDI